MLNPVKYRGQSDQELMRRWRKGEKRACEELYRRYSTRLYSYFRRMLGEDHRAEDLLHDAFVKIVARPALYNPDRSFRVWIFSMAHNLCCNELRRAGLRRVTELRRDLSDLASEPPQAEKRLDGEYFRLALFDALSGVDEEVRSAFLLRFQQELTIREISNALGRPEGTIRSRLFYLTRKLGDSLRAFRYFAIEDQNGTA
jgi:RNA polymerase sigma-70 factor (ECF subfamily)